MKQVSEKVQKYVNEHIGEFHQARLDSLQKLKLNTVLKRKNPYLFRAKGFNSAVELIQSLVDAFLSSNEEILFGDWMERLAIFINSVVYGGRKSGIEGIDLEFDKKGVRYIVSIKSGPNWGNSQQIKKMRESFITAKKTLNTSKARLTIQPVNGCCYGKNNQSDSGDYWKLCGQEFWTFISGDPNLYKDIVEPLGYQAKKHNDDFLEIKGGLITTFVIEFAKDFCDDQGIINWKKLVEFNSGKVE